MNNRVILFSGGTGGHVIPAVNLGNFIIQNGGECYLFLDSRGLKYANQYKGKIFIINSSHFTGNIFFKIKSSIYLLLALFRSFYLLIKIRPSICIGFGSYASFAPLLISSLFKFLKICKVYVHEQNSIIGKVNLFFLPFVDNIFLNFDNIVNLKNKYSIKGYQVGIPRDQFNIINKKTIKHKNKKELTIFVYGGSQGSINLIKIFIEIIKKLDLNYHKILHLIIQAPESQFYFIQNNLDKIRISYKIKIFYKDINKILNKSDIIIGRSGAGTIDDIINCKKPSILIPFPYSLDNHQIVNARYLSDKKAAILINEENFDLISGYKIFKELLDDENYRLSIIKNLNQIKNLDANQLIFNKIS